MKRRIVTAVIFIALAVSAVTAQNINPGSIESYQRQTDGVLITMENTVMKIFVHTDNILRVLFSADSVLPDIQSVAVAESSWDPVDFTVSESGDTLVIATSYIQACIDKANGSITYKDQSGNVVARENGSYGKQIWRDQTDTTYGFRSRFVSPADEAVYGLGQHQVPVLNWKGTTVGISQYNTKISNPVLLSSRGYSLFWATPLRADFYWENNNAEFIYTCGANAKAIDYYFMYGPQPDSLVARYRILTGQAPMIPRWALGYWQSKNRYTWQDTILNVVRQFRQRDLPIDNIVVDYTYWEPEPWGSHSFNARWPDPTEMNDILHDSLHVRSMISVWPRFESGSDNYDELYGAGCIPDCEGLPGSGLNFDPIRAKECRDIYGRQIQEDILVHGFDALWLDGTEPERHLCGENSIRENIYSLMTCKSVHNAMVEQRPDKRPFILTRSAWAGQQRYNAASWSGDVKCTFDVLRTQIPAGLNFCMAGIPYWCTGIGGYMGYGSPLRTDELITRWFQYGTFCPIFRVHGVDAKKPWEWEQTTYDVMKEFMDLRYRLLPYIYACAAKTTFEHYTMMRALFMDFGDDPAVHDIIDQFMFGPAFLINPVTDSGATSRDLYLPDADWYDFWTGEELTGKRTITAEAPLEKMPIYIRAGSIVPMGNPVRHTNAVQDTIELRVYTGANANVTLYEDDGVSFDYTNEDLSRIPMSWNDAAQTLTIDSRRGSYTQAPDTYTFNVVWVDENHGAGVPITQSPDVTVDYTGAVITIDKQTGLKNGKTLRDRHALDNMAIQWTNTLLQTAGDVAPKRISIHDSRGRLIVSATQQKKVSLKGLGTGTYFYRVFTGKKIIRGKFLITR